MRPTLYTPSGAKVALMPEPEAIGAWTIPSSNFKRAPPSSAGRHSSVSGVDGTLGVDFSPGADLESISSNKTEVKTETTFKGRPKRRKWANNLRTGGTVTPMDSHG